MDTQESVAKGRAIVARFKDRATYEDMDELVTVFESLPVVAWVADDTEMCVFCAWPESSTVVLRIGHSITVCQDHIWRGLLAKLGDHPRGDYAKAYPGEQEEIDLMEYDGNSGMRQCLGVCFGHGPVGSEAVYCDGRCNPDD